MTTDALDRQASIKDLISSSLSAFKAKKNILLWMLYGLTALGSLYRIDYVINYNPVNHIWSDPERHWVQGTHPERNDPMVLTDPVIYQLYIASLAKLTFKEPNLVAFYTILLCLFTPWVWYRFFRELQPSRLMAVGGWAAITWLPSWLSIYAYFMQETLMLPLLGLALWMTWRCKRKQTLNSFLLIVLLWSLAGLTRGICIPLAATATTWLWLEQSQKLPKAIYSALILILVLGPLSYRSYQHMGIFAPHGVGHMNMLYAKSGKLEVRVNYKRKGAVWLFGFMSPAALTTPLTPLSDWKSQRTGTVNIHINIDNGSADWKRAAKENSLSLSKYLWITKENLIFLFFSDSWPDSNKAYPLGYANYLMRWIWAPLALICIVTIILQIRRRDQRLQFLLPALLITWFILQGLMPIVLNEGRYRKPFEGLAFAQIILFLGTRRRQLEQQDALLATNPRDNLETESELVPTTSTTEHLSANPVTEEDSTHE